MSEVNTENLVWRCNTCKKDYPPTSSVYAGLIRKAEHKNHEIRLVNKKTGEVVAKSLQDALKKELIEKKVETSEEGIEMTEQGDILIPVRMLLPAYIFTMYSEAKRNDLSDHANIADFMVEYTQFGFMKAHNVGLSLAPLESSPQGDGSEIMQALRNISDKLDKHIAGEKEEKVEEEVKE